MSNTLISDDARETTRRLWAAAPFVSLLVAGAGFFVSNRTEGVAGIAVALLAGAATVAMLVTAYGVYAWRNEWAHRPDDDLDEMQVARRDSAYRLAYMALSTLGAVAVVGSQVALDVVDDITVSEVSSVAVVGWFVVAFCLPSSILLWIDDDIDAHDAEVSR